LIVVRSPPRLRKGEEDYDIPLTLDCVAYESNKKTLLTHR